MIRNGDRPSQSLRAKTRGLDSKSDSFPVTVTHGLNLGCPGRPTLKESQTTLTRDHRRPIASIIHMPFSQDKPVPTNVGKDRYARPESQEGGFVQDLAKPRKISQDLLSFQKTRPVSNNQINGALTKSNGSRGRTSTNPSQWGNWNASGTLWQ